MARQQLFYKKIHEFEREHEGMQEQRKQCQTAKEVFDYIFMILKEEETDDGHDTTERSAAPIVTKEEVPAPRKTVRKNKRPAKAKPVNGHVHYSSSSEENSESSEEEDQVPVKEVDEHGNEVISTSDAIWKTSAEVEHTENENMDDFISQLFMYTCLYHILFLKASRSKFDALSRQRRLSECSIENLRVKSRCMT